MTLIDAVTLFGVMAALAAIPSSSTLLVITRAATLNTQNGLVTAAGIVAGDLIFIAMVILGMSALAEQLGALFVLIKYLAAAYLIWFGLSLIRQQAKTPPGEGYERLRPHDKQTRSKSSLATSFTAGLLLTLGDIKAIVFYASLLPLFVNLTSITKLDILVVCSITLLAVGGIKVVYALAAQRVVNQKRYLSHGRKLTIASGGLMVGAGGYLLFK